MLAFVFPGQGSQKVGMGKDLLEARPDLFDRYFDAADAAAAAPIRQYAIEGPIESLTETDIAQPALFALSLAVLELARESGVQAAFVAGHSLGEYTAAVASGALAYEDGIRLVAERGRLMANAQNERPGSMAAIIGLSLEQVVELCAKAAEGGVVAPANLNTPTQIVISGEADAVDRAIEMAQGAGAKKAVKLQVGAAFHSELMKPAQERMAELMQDVVWADPDVPLASNASGGLVTTAAEVQQALIDQIASPVRWVDCVQALKAAGVTHTLEVGPGRTLTSLVRSIDRDIEGAAVDSPTHLASFATKNPDLVQVS